jgi:hypothetical protein
MNPNPRIRIIKRAERLRKPETLVAKRPASASDIVQEKARDAANTIKGWIVNSRQQKQQSAVSALWKPPSR